MENEVNNKKKIKNTMYIVFGTFALILFMITRMKPSLAEELFSSGEHGVALEENGMREVSGDDRCGYVFDSSDSGPNAYLENGESTEYMYAYPDRNCGVTHKFSCVNGSITGSVRDDGQGEVYYGYSACHVGCEYNENHIEYGGSIDEYKWHNVQYGEDCEYVVCDDEKDGENIYGYGSCYHSYKINIDGQDKYIEYDYLMALPGWANYQSLEDLSNSYNGVLYTKEEPSAGETCDDLKYEIPSSADEGTDLGAYFSQCEDPKDPCTTSDGEKVEDGETIQGYLRGDVRYGSCDDTRSYTDFDTNSSRLNGITHTYSTYYSNKQDFVCNNGKFYLKDNKLYNSYGGSHYDPYDGIVSDVYKSCHVGCAFESSLYVDTTKLENGSYNGQYIKHGVTIQNYPYPNVYGIETCKLQTLTCNEGKWKGSDRADNEALGYGSCNRGCEYADHYSKGGTQYGVFGDISRVDLPSHEEKLYGYLKGKVYGESCGSSEYYYCENGNWYEYDNGTKGDSVDEVYYQCNAGCLLDDGETEVEDYYTNYQTVKVFPSKIVPAGESCGEPVELYCSAPNFRYRSNSQTADGSRYSSCEVEVSGCELQDGTKVADGGTIDAYVKSESPNSLGCVSATLKCNGGILEFADSSEHTDREGNTISPNGYGFHTCTTVKGESCYLSEDSTEVEDNETVTAYVKNLVSNEESCSSDTLKCYDGTLEFSDGAKYHENENYEKIYPYGYGFSGCTVAVPCTLHDGTLVKHGDSITAYKQNTVSYGSSCNGEYDVDVATVYCFNGKFYTSNDTNYYEDIYESLGYGWSGCTVAAPQDCELDGEIVKYTEEIVAYKKKVVESGAVCEGISRKCNGGTLGGDNTYQYASCKTEKMCATGTIENGEYVQELVDVVWNPTLNNNQGGWNSTPLCTNFTCNTGYHKDNNACVKDATSSSSSSSSGGGGGGKKTEKEKTAIDKVEQTVEKETQNKVEEKTENKVEEKVEEHNSAEEKPDTTKVEESKTQQNSNTISAVSNSETQSTVKGGGSTAPKYTEEQKEAYTFAKSNGITTTKSIETAKVDAPLTRIQMAKMLSNYAINVLGKEPDTSKGSVEFNDVTDKMNKQYDNAVTKAYQLGIMGQNMNNNKFRPNDEVKRSEFVTALSRLLYDTQDSEYKGTGKYYVPHMTKMYNEGIINKSNPSMKEKRGYVMIMLMRSAK